jgi:hypothetical protein
MDMIKVVILEDDREQAELTESFLKQYAPRRVIAFLT